MLNSLTPDMYTVFYYRSTETFGFFSRKLTLVGQKKFVEMRLSSNTKITLQKCHGWLDIVVKWIWNEH